MKKVFIKITTLLLSLVLLYSCTACVNSNKETTNVIPQDNIRYTSFVFGNVIDEGKQAIFLNFYSDYVVTKMEIEGTLVDINGNVVYAFDEVMNFGPPSKTPDFPISIDANLIKSVKFVSFTKIQGYTTEDINSYD